MVRRVIVVSHDFSGRDVISALTSFNYQKDRQRGSHVILKYTNPDTDEVRTVTVPLHDRIRIGTLQSIAEQCGADDFEQWCEWIDKHE